MFNALGLSVYVSAFAQQKQMLEQLAGTNSYIFTSFHIQEEFNESYVANAIAMCQWLKDSGFKIIADLSPKTLKLFGHSSIPEFATEMELDILRLDYGFQEHELTVARHFPIAFNASTVDKATAQRILDTGGQVYAMHNFYPRPETGLDADWFTAVNRDFTQMGLKILAFIPGDEVKRGPVFQGLPTLEKHRLIPPYVAYADLAENFAVDGIFLGDIRLSSLQRQLILDYAQTGVTAIPAELSPGHQNLYDQVFTIRPDSPQRIKRLQESREYSSPGKSIEPSHCKQRNRGSITMDNQLYGRYSGEIQILCSDYPQDERVNVIGDVVPEYIDILDCLPNGKRIKFRLP